MVLRPRPRPRLNITDVYCVFIFKQIVYFSNTLLTRSLAIAKRPCDCCIILLQDHSQKIVVYSQVSDEAVEALDRCNFAAIVRFSFIILFYFILFIYLFARIWYNIKQLLKQLHEQDNKAVINSTDSCPILLHFETRCSAIAERPRCRVRYSFRQKQNTGTGSQ